ncbi:hypothetical protein Tcan_08657 [Toxocara canis]|uniref:Uncharacterized protein n=1 Tax=Toxocara canis TaxID=6265 RepID=A0A0B2UM62_TOXCA|nr:hypothetical protein Tcan_08657 [Toxocara canis]
MVSNVRNESSDSLQSTMITSCSTAIELTKGTSNLNEISEKSNGYHDEQTAACISETSNASAKFGEPISDDLINMYCDKLNTALNGKFDGMLALQYTTLEPNDLDRLITGKKPVLQILFDRKREHYVLVEWKPFDKVVTIFDSLATQQENTATAVSISFK